jgi:hypothetical protein
MNAPASIWDSVQPRYAAYCRAHGAASPAEMKDRDALSYPCARNMNFVRWINGRWRDWRLARGRAPESLLLDTDHADFDAWLKGAH